MKDTIFEDYVFIKERIEFHCDKIIELLNERKQPVIFVLWGNDAKTKKMGQI